MTSKTTMLGLDIGSCSLKWASMEHGAVRRSGEQNLSDNLVQNGRITSIEVLSSELRNALKQGKAKKGACAVVLPAETVIVRRLTMPYMTVDQLHVNLPYEFHDFIKGEKENYFFDYAVIGRKENEEGKPAELDLLAAATRKETVADYRKLLHKSGLRLTRAVPACIAYGNLIRAYESVSETCPPEYCILDMGYRSIQMYIYRGSVYETARTIEYGGATLDTLIADAAAVDPHVAAAYKQSNYNSVLDSQACKELYSRIAMEIMRAVNFYGFNTPDTNLKDLYFTGGLSRIPVLTDAIRQELDLTVHPIEDLIPDVIAGEFGKTACPSVLGALLQGDGK